MAYTELVALDGASNAEIEIRWARAVHFSVLVMLLVVAICVPLTNVNLVGIPLSAFFFSHQDVYFVPLIFAATLLRPSRQDPVTEAKPFGSRLSFAYPLLIIPLMVLICWAGHYFILDGYSLSRDEAMAHFDAFIFGHGRLSWPIAEPWRSYSTALNQVFIMPIGQHDAWVSSYLPVNAAFRGAVGTVADPWLTSPLFVGLGALSLWRITLRIWPGSSASRLVALTLFAGSAQILMAGMTAYAMSAHLGLDLFWLWLFLRGGKLDHIGAVVVGFLATGLHQPLFHPLFVLPIFYELLFVPRRWRLLAFYAVAYALISLFWMSWPSWIANGFGATSQTHEVGYLSRLLGTVGRFDWKSAWVMALNLLRFATWQHLLLLPLLSLGMIVGRADPLARALTVGFLLPILLMAILLPVQGHGWGYRYLQGVVGNACLLGAYAWHWLETRGFSFRRAFVGASVLTFVGLPIHAAMAHGMVHPYAKTAAEIAAIDADVVIIDEEAAPWGGDLVLNRPDLGNRPIRLAAGGLKPAELKTLCHGRTIAFVDERDLYAIKQLFGSPSTGGTQHQHALEVAAKQAGCSIVEP